MTNTTDESRRADAREPLAADFIIPLLACGLAGYYLATTTDLVWEARAAGVAVGVPLIAMCVFHMGRTHLPHRSGQRQLQQRRHVRQHAVQPAAPGARHPDRRSSSLPCPWTGTTLGLFLVLIASMWMLGVHEYPPRS